MGEPLIAGMPPDCPLDFGCTVEFVTLDPTDGSTVTGVTVSNASIYVQGGGAGTDLASGPFMLVPGPQA